jgi:DNA invertase Pin-like site-specific DNA recombinase
MSDKIRAHHVQRKAILYVRQSTPYQVGHNIESQHLQYAVEQRLHELGWREVEIVDEDLGRTASGTVVRSGFQRIVSEVCLGKVGGVAAREVSRLARNNKDWHQLIEMCSVVDTLLIDQETVFDSRNSNDRLLLGLKGSMSAYELDLLRQRALEARRQKAERGELLLAVPAGFIKTSDGQLQKDPDIRVQQGIGRVFDKFLQLGSARQVVRWYHEHDLMVPVKRPTGSGWKTLWRVPTTTMVNRVLTNPFHAGTYVWGRRKVVAEVRDGVVKKSVRKQSPENYDVFIPDHHEGYVSRETFDGIQAMLSDNVSRWSSGSRGAVKDGEALLAGLLRCRRCGRKLNVAYTGEARRQRYLCSPGRVSGGKFGCIRISGREVDDAVSNVVLKVVRPGAIEAAAQAIEVGTKKQGEALQALGLELRAARYEAERAGRQYDEIEPENRLVAAELETRWNTALEKVAALEKRLREEESRSTISPPDLQAMLEVADDFEAIWNVPSTDARLKKRIIRTLIEEVLVDVNAEAALVELVIHWKGGVHTELRVARRRPAEHGRGTSEDTVDAVRVLARVCSDSKIAQLLSRNNRLTGNGSPWTRESVTWLRSRYQIPGYSKASQRETGWMTLTEAAAYVGVNPRTLRLRAERGEVEVLHPLPYGPWVFRRDTLDNPKVRQRFDHIRHRGAPASQYSLNLSRS